MRSSLSSSPAATPDDDTIVARKADRINAAARKDLVEVARRLHSFNAKLLDSSVVEVIECDPTYKSSGRTGLNPGVAWSITQQGGFHYWEAHEFVAIEPKFASTPGATGQARAMRPIGELITLASARLSK